VACLLSAPFLSLATEDVFFSEELPPLVLYSNPYGRGGGVVFRVDWKNGQPCTTQLASNVRGVNVTESGKFICRHKDGRWLRGDVNDPAGQHLDVTEFIPKSSDGTYPFRFTLSHDGQKLALTSYDRDPMNSLLDYGTLQIVSLDEQEPFTFVLQKNATMDAPSWSPDDTTLVYYLGREGKRGTVGYRLVALDVNEVLTLERVLGPESVQVTSVSMRRPEWSPDGQNILYMGRYEESEGLEGSLGLVNSPFSILNVESGHITPVTGFHRMWSSDSRAIHTYVRRKGTYAYDLFRTVKKGAEAKEEVIVEDLSSKYGQPLAALSNDGKKWLFSRVIGKQPIQESEIYVLDVTNGAMLSVMKWPVAWDGPQCRMIRSSL
jgi:hypothetical protein